MKFLSIWERRETMPLPPNALRQLAEAQGAYAKQNLKAGEIKEIYYAPGWDRFIIISEDESIEDWYKAASAGPAFAFFKIELYPLADFTESMKTMSEMLKRMENIAAAMPK